MLVASSVRHSWIQSGTAALLGLAVSACSPQRPATPSDHPAPFLLPQPLVAQTDEGIRLLAAANPNSSLVTIQLQLPCSIGDNEASVFTALLGRPFFRSQVTDLDQPDVDPQGPTSVTLTAPYSRLDHLIAFFAHGIQSLSAADRPQWRSCFRPTGITVVVLGRIGPSAVIAELKRAFDHTLSSGAATEIPPLRKGPSVNVDPSRSVSVAVPISQMADLAAWRRVAAILSADPRGRILQPLRHYLGTQLTVDTALQVDATGSRLVVTLDPPVLSQSTLEEIVRRELYFLALYGPTEREWQHASRNERAALYRQYVDPKRLAQWIGELSQIDPSPSMAAAYHRANDALLARQLTPLLHHLVSSEPFTDLPAMTASTSTEMAGCLLSTPYCQIPSKVCRLITLMRQPLRSDVTLHLSWLLPEGISHTSERDPTRLSSQLRAHLSRQPVDRHLSSIEISIDQDAVSLSRTVGIRDWRDGIRDLLVAATSGWIRRQFAAQKLFLTAVGNVSPTLLAAETNHALTHPLLYQHGNENNANAIASIADNAANPEPVANKAPVTTVATIAPGSASELYPAFLVFDQLLTNGDGLLYRLIPKLRTVTVDSKYLLGCDSGTYRLVVSGEQRQWTHLRQTIAALLERIASGNFDPSLLDLAKQVEGWKHRMLFDSSHQIARHLARTARCGQPPTDLYRIQQQIDAVSVAEIAIIARQLGNILAESR